MSKDDGATTRASSDSSAALPPEFDPQRVSVYVHFPYCARKCPYCDFATRGMPERLVPHEAYADAVLRELEARVATLSPEARLASVFFGGGTPSLWRTDALARVLAGIRAAIPSVRESGGAGGAGGDAIEITAECNPQSFDRAKAEALRAAGVNRVSIGVQSLDDDRLAFLGRLHDQHGALAALAAANEVFDRFSADLMFGSPGQTEAQLTTEIARILDAGARHVSAYALTIEPDTRFGELYRDGKLKVATDETYASLFEGAEAVFEGAGLRHYEISNYAADGEESVHNLHYWRGGSYLGLGAAAVGCVSGVIDGSVGVVARRHRNEPDGGRYIARVMAGETRPEVESESLDGRALLREALMLGLRTAEGVHVPAAEARASLPLETGREKDLQRALAEGRVVRDGPWLRVPREQWFALDGIVASLF